MKSTRIHWNPPKSKLFQTFFRKCLKKKFEYKKKLFFNEIFFETYILSEVLKNAFLWQSDHGLCHQTTVYRSRKFAKNQENTYALGHAPMGSIISKVLSQKLSRAIEFLKNQQKFSDLNFFNFDVFDLKFGLQWGNVFLYCQKAGFLFFSIFSMVLGWYFCRMKW